MPRKKFEETEEERYSPLNADLLRDAAAVGRQQPRAVEKPEPAVSATATAPEPPSEPTATVPGSDNEKVVELPRPATRQKDNRRGGGGATARRTAPKAKEPAPGRGKTSDGPTKRVRISSDEDRAISRFLSRLYEDTGARVYLSQLARVGWTLALQAEPEFREELARSPLPSLPSTHDTVAYADYEERLLALLHRAVRKARVQ